MKLGSGEAVQTIAWNLDGSLLATTGKDKFLRVIDPRASDAKPAMVLKQEKTLREDTLLERGDEDMHVEEDRQREVERERWKRRGRRKEKQRGEGEGERIT